MNDLLVALTISLALYYFLIYLPNKNKPLTKSVGIQTNFARKRDKDTQTEPDDQLETTLDNLIKNIQNLNKQL